MHIADSSVDGKLAAQWITSSQSLLGRVFGQNSDHYRNFTNEFTKGISYSPAKRAHGVLHAALDDYESGALFKIRSLIQAEVFDDLLEQAEALHESGYYQPAAVLAGAVLEDGLRQLCDTNDISLPDKPKLDYINAQLARAGVYNKLVLKRITALADLRNKAAHGEWNEFNVNDVADMLTAIRRFLEEYVA